ncbi:hypothetical protein SAMN05443634_106118 [Chishuiella changwenlii]|uniref:Uncharacterized protein n=1 Tax=Chishuiella changwenlii TaxID=1434701 RepID=A0A1M6Y6Z3_9FLAO|nr:DUF6452 family protein [Chishuiella changwenlii]GGE93300.1 hypothetical protein GCM10010984_08650 [Chishuiella changwenlii]SHL14054.1 hypothetical protein SAMN05443634_106118 [Chishuiella changwenlii]
MKKIQSILSFAIVAMLFSFVLYSCEDDDICTDDGEVPRMVANMYYNGTDVALEDTIYYWAYVLDTITPNRESDTVQIENGVVNNASTFGISVRQNLQKKVFYTIAQGPDRVVRDTIDGVPGSRTILAQRDKLVLEYGDLGNGYTSKACGFGLTFKDVNVTLRTGANGQGNWIRSIETVNTEITNGSTTIIKLFANERN